MIGDRRSDSPRRYDYGFDLNPYTFDFDDDSTILASPSSPSRPRLSPTFVPVGPAIPGRDTASGRELGSGNGDDHEYHGAGKDGIAFGFGTNIIFGDGEGTVSIENAGARGSAVDDHIRDGEEPPNPEEGTKSESVTSKADEDEGASGLFNNDNDDGEKKNVVSDSSPVPSDDIGSLGNDGEYQEKFEERGVAPLDISQDGRGVGVEIDDVSQVQEEDSETSESSNVASDFDDDSILFGLFGDYQNDMGDEDDDESIPSEVDEDAGDAVSENKVIFDIDDLSPEPAVGPDTNGETLAATNPQEATTYSLEDSILFGLLDNVSVEEEPFRLDFPLDTVSTSASSPARSSPESSVSTQKEEGNDVLLGLFDAAPSSKPLLNSGDQGDLPTPDIPGKTGDGVLFGLFDIPVSTTVESNSEDDNAVEDLPLPDISDDGAVFGLFDLAIDDAFRDEGSPDDVNVIDDRKPGSPLSSPEGRAIDQAIANEVLSGDDTKTEGNKLPTANVGDEILFGIYDPAIYTEPVQGDDDTSLRTLEGEGNEVLFGLFDALPSSKSLRKSGNHGDLPTPDIPGQTGSVPEPVSRDASDFLTLLGVGSESEEGDELEDIFHPMEEVRKDDELEIGREYPDEITVSTAYSLPIAALFDVDGEEPPDESIDKTPDGIFNLLANFDENSPETHDKVKVSFTS